MQNSQCKYYAGILRIHHNQLIYNMKILTKSRGTQIDTDTCVSQIGNRFDLVIAASARVRELIVRHKRAESPEQLNAPVTALLEIQNGKVGPEYLRKVR
jgi:DNA-directed RNA polymerase omega subunit